MASGVNFTFMLALIPLVLGAVGMVSRSSFSLFQPIGLTAIVLEAGGLIHFAPTLETNPSVTFLMAAILLSSFCSLLGQRDAKTSSTGFASIMIVLGLSLGVLLGHDPIGRLFLIGFLVYAATSFMRLERPTLLSKLILMQLVVAIVLCSASLFIGNTFSTLAGLFLAITLLPLTPFHLPFVSIVSSAQGTLAGFWVVAWLALGLAELHKLQASMPADVFAVIQILAFGSALYASLKCLGQNHIRLFLAYATVAQVALLWGLANVFSNFSQWGIQFGIAVALVISGLFITFAFVQHRYGYHSLGTLPGLASSMPRLGRLFVLLISIAVLLPIVPTFSGLVAMPTIENRDQSLLLIFLMFLTIWLLGSWYFSNLLHQTAFGKARPDIPYTDLQKAEIFSVGLLILGASYSALVY
jgi:NADH:ubiquinone oxidoreductase subunit 4 (subunit M)